MTYDYDQYYGGYAPTYQVGSNKGLATSQAPNHSHPFSGVTSGGYDTDKPSFAGVQYVITIGFVAP